MRGETLLDHGETRIAGLPAYFLVWETEHVSESGERRFITIEWGWVKDKKAYWLRGLSQRHTFAAGHRRLFERVAKTVEFK